MKAYESAYLISDYSNRNKINFFNFQRKISAIGKKLPFSYVLNINYSKHIKSSINTNYRYNFIDYLYNKAVEKAKDIYNKSKKAVGIALLSAPILAGAGAINKIKAVDNPGNVWDSNIYFS